MKPIDFLIMFENKNREYESALLLMQILEQRGHSVRLVQNNWSERVARIQYSPKVIVTPWCYDDADYDYFSAYVGGLGDGRFNLINLHCEQVVRGDTLKWYTPSGKSAEVYHCAWGDWYRDQLLASGIEGDLVCVTGSPRLDFFRREFSATGKSDLAPRYGLDSDRIWILIVGNFSSAFMSEDTLSQLSARGLGNQESIRELSMRTYEAVLDWLDRALSEPDVADRVNVVYRPHPSEPITDSLVRLTERYENFKCTKDLSIREWFQCCDAAFTWCSTSSAEAAHADIPILALRPYEIPAEERIDLVEELRQITSSEQFRDCVLDIAHGGVVETSPAFLAEVGKYYGESDELAAEKTAALAERCLLERSHVVRGAKRPGIDSYWRAAKYVVKMVLLRLGVLKHFNPVFAAQIDNLPSADDISAYESVVSKYWTRGDRS